MKQFRKSNERKFICEECGKTFKGIQPLSNHIGQMHVTISKKDYFDKWLKDEDDGKCKICKKQTKFTNKLDIGYHVCCCKKCTDIYRSKQTQKGCLIIYGVNTPFKHQGCRQKSKQTRKEKYGNENYTNREKARKTCIERNGCEYKHDQMIKTNNKKYGVDYPFQSKNIQNKALQTIRKKYNVDNISQLKETKDKSKKTCLLKYGVEYALQNNDICLKQQKRSFKIEYYLNTNIHYRGTYEYDFLEKYYSIFLSDLDNGPTIKYIFNGKQHYYHSDFLIKSKNLVIEIKNSYLMKRYKENIETKAAATVANGYNYIIIVNKNYDKFNFIL